MKSIKISSRHPPRKRKRTHISQFKWKSTKVVSTEKTYAGYVPTITQGFWRGIKCLNNCAIYFDSKV